MFNRICLNCKAVFKEPDSLDKLRTHQENCTNKEPYLNDETADFYEEEILN